MARAVLLPLLTLLGVGWANVARAEPAPAPQAVVSLDYCADQYVLRLVDRARIRAVSPDAGADYSYMRDAARGLPHVRPTAEEVLALAPDLVVRSYGGGPRVAAFLERVGVPVLQVGYASDLAQAQEVVVEMARGLGNEPEGAVIAAEMEARLAAVARATATSGAGSSAGAALYVTPGGVTAGRGTMINALFEAAGLTSFEEGRGWRPIPLEPLAYETPDRVARARFGAADPVNAWSSARHPVLRARTRGVPETIVEGAWTACAGWYLVDAVEALAAPARRDAP